MKLRQWYAVHSRSNTIPSPAAILDSVRPRLDQLICDFQEPDANWRAGQLRFKAESIPLILLSRESVNEQSSLWFRDGWEAELRSWPGPNCDPVIEHLRSRQQTFSLKPIDPRVGATRLARICEQVCGYLARETDGLIHVFQEGFFTTQGESFFPVNPKHKLKTTSLANTNRPQL